MTEFQKNALTAVAIGAALYVVFGQRVKVIAQATGDAINPVSSNNIFNQGAVAIGKALGGDPNADTLFDFFKSDNPALDAATAENLASAADERGINHVSLNPGYDALLPNGELM